MICRCGEPLAPFATGSLDGEEGDILVAAFGNRGWDADDLGGSDTAWLRYSATDEADYHAASEDDLWAYLHGQDDAAHDIRDDRGTLVRSGLCALTGTNRTRRRYGLHLPFAPRVAA